MVRHEQTTTNWKAKRGYREEKHLILGHVALNPNAFSGALESVRVIVGEDLKKENAPMFVDLRNWVQSDKYTGPSKKGGIRLDRHHLIELLSMLPEIKEAMEINDNEILNEIDERKAALDEQKE
jgi:hypothetical protein